MNNFSEFNIQPIFPLKGTKESVMVVKNKPIVIRDFRFITKTQDEQTHVVCQIQFNYETETINRITFTRSKIVRGQLERLDKTQLPFTATIKEKDNCLYLE